MAEEYILPKETILVWRIRLTALFGIICSVFNLWYIFVALLILYFVLSFWYFPRYINTFCVIINCNTVTVKRGVIFYSTYIIPVQNIIYINTYTSPLAQKYGLSAVALKVVKGYILIPEVKNTTVEKLLSLPRGKINAD